MARKIIPYPCDYKTTASVRRARRGGNVFVIILCIVIALLLGAGTYFALTNDRQALKTLDSLHANAVCPGSDKTQSVQSDAPVSEAEPARTPMPTAEPTDTPVPATEEPTAAPTEQPTSPTTAEAPSVIAPVLTPAPSPDPLYEDRMAKAFSEETVATLPDIVEACTPGVVGILNYQYGTFRLVAAASGSGFILTEDGYIVTNQHVIADAQKVSVLLDGGEEVEAKLVGSDVMSDIAVLKIEHDNLTPLPIGNSDTLRVGEFVLAIGNPLSTEELYGSVTFGIISATAREINIDGFTNEFLQTDAAINPGNSGGPLINMNGEVIGVTNAKYFSAGYDDAGNELHTEGIGFAIPMNNVITIVDSIIKNGAIPRPGIGVMIGVRSEAEAAMTNLPAGVYIDSITPGGPAEAAGLQLGDVLVALDGVEMTQNEFIQAIRGRKIGEELTFTVLRDSETLEIVVTVGDLNQMN